MIVSHATGCSTLVQAEGRRRYRRAHGGICSTCLERPSRFGQRTCALCHAIYMRAWRLKTNTQPAGRESDRPDADQTASAAVRENPVSGWLEAFRQRDPQTNPQED